MPPEPATKPGPPAATIGPVAPSPSLLSQVHPALFDKSPIGIAFLDEENRLTRANAAFYRLVLGQLPEPPATGVGVPIASLLKPANGPDWPQPLTPGPETGYEVAFGHGQTGTAFVATDADHAAILHLIDTSHLKKLEIQFAQSQKMLAVGKLAGGIAHDFNNLLTAIIGFCDLLLLRHQPGDPSFADMMQIKQNANRAANLVRQLLAFSRQQTMQPRAMHLADVVADLSNLLNRLLGAGIALEVEHGPNVNPVCADRVQLEQVLINLAVNSRDAMDGKGILRICCRNTLRDDHDLTKLSPPLPPGQWVSIQVSDTGPGIPRQHLDQIFEPFFTTKPIGEGTGLGLSTVYGIVKQTGGYIYADNPPGGGALFTIYLPAHTAAVPQTHTPAQRADLTGDGEILLVEDEDPVRVFCARALRGKGYRVTEVRTGQAAMTLIKDGRTPFDLMITDIVMPEMDGPALIEQARATTPQLPVICISGYAEGAFREKLNQFDNIIFLAKPFTLQQLAKAVKDATTDVIINH